MVDGNRKGGEFELEVAYAMSEWAAPRPDFEPWSKFAGYELPFRRRPADNEHLVSGMEGQRDLLHRADIHFPFSIECKKIEDWDFDGMWTAPKWPVWQWWSQTVAQADTYGLHPLLVFTRNRRPNFAMVDEGVLKWAKPQLPSSAHLVEVRRPGGSVVGLLELPVLMRARLVSLAAPRPSKVALPACPPASLKTSSAIVSAVTAPAPLMSGLKSSLRPGRRF